MLERKYPEVAFRLEQWALWNRGGNSIGYPSQSAMKERIGVMRLRSENWPERVEATEAALVCLPVKWQKVLVYQWAMGMGQREIARKMRVGRTQLWALRSHAYGMLKDILTPCEQM